QVHIIVRASVSLQAPVRPSPPLSDEVARGIHMAKYLNGPEPHKVLKRQVLPEFILHGFNPWRWWLGGGKSRSINASGDCPQVPSGCFVPTHVLPPFTECEY